jgi:hypothetical protein
MSSELFLKINVTKLLGKNELLLIIHSEVALFYIDNADRDLLLFALNNFNEAFLKFALRQSIIGINLMV